MAKTLALRLQKEGRQLTWKWESKYLVNKYCLDQTQ